MNNEYYVFKYIITKLELDRIESISFGTIKTEPHPSTNIINPNIKTILKIDDKLLYYFNKNGTIKKMIILVFLMMIKSKVKMVIF